MNSGRRRFIAVAIALSCTSAALFACGGGGAGGSGGSSAAVVSATSAPLTFAAAPSALAATTFDANGNITTTALAAHATVPLTVDGSPAIADITR